MAAPVFGGETALLYAKLADSAHPRVRGGRRCGTAPARRLA